MENGCPDCFHEQRSLNDILIQTKIDAQKEATAKNKNAAIIQEGRTYRYELFEGQPPSGTIKVIMPG